MVVKDFIDIRKGYNLVEFMSSTDMKGHNKRLRQPKHRRSRSESSFFFSHADEVTEEVMEEVDNMPPPDLQRQLSNVSQLSQMSQDFNSPTEKFDASSSGMSNAYMVYDAEDLVRQSSGASWDSHQPSFKVPRVRSRKDSGGSGSEIGFPALLQRQPSESTIPSISRQRSRLDSGDSVALFQESLISCGAGGAADGSNMSQQNNLSFNPRVFSSSGTTDDDDRNIGGGSGVDVLDQHQPNLDPIRFISSKGGGRDGSSGTQSASCSGDTIMSNKSGAISDDVVGVQLTLENLAKFEQLQHDTRVDAFVMKRSHNAHRRTQSLGTYPTPQNSSSGTGSSVAPGPRGHYKCGKCGQLKAGGHVCAVHKWLGRDMGTQTGEGLFGPNGEHPFEMHATLPVALSSSIALLLAAKEREEADEDMSPPMRTTRLGALRSGAMSEQSMTQQCTPMEDGGTPMSVSGNYVRVELSDTTAMEI